MTTKGEWKYIISPLVGLGDNEQWYFVGSPERAIGFIRHEEDAKLIVHAPAMLEFLLFIESELRDYAENSLYDKEAVCCRVFVQEMADSIKDFLEEVEHE